MIRQDDKIKYQIIGYQYFGSIELYSTLVNLKDIKFCIDLSYNKAQHPNRTWIYGPNGLISLSVPLLGGRNQKMPFKDVRVADDGSWRRIHWRSIHDSYRKSPWFEELGWRVERLYQKPAAFLLDWNLRCMHFCFEVLKLESDILTHYPVSNNGEFLFQNRTPHGYGVIGYPTYQQVFMDRFGFMANLSILDLLFCEGPGAIDYLMKWHQHKISIST
jgi:hypothetical protein